MTNIKNKIKKLEKQTEVKRLVKKKIGEFKRINKKGSARWYQELCFCILTANSSAEKVLKIWKNLREENAFLKYSEEDLSNALKENGYRFYNIRAKYILGSRKHSISLKRKIKELKNLPEARKWLVNNIKGIGWKESSHFLRNIGYFNFAILDRHILRVLEECDVIQKIPSTLSKKRYHKIEEKMKKIASDLKMNLAEIDLYLWYSKTGKIIK